jgi:hypothetical protein
MDVSFREVTVDDLRHHSIRGEALIAQTDLAANKPSTVFPQAGSWFILLSLAARSCGQ